MVLIPVVGVNDGAFVEFVGEIVGDEDGVLLGLNDGDKVGVLLG